MICRTTIGLVLVMCSVLRADPVIVPGAYLGFVTPHPPYSPEDVNFSIGLGYGTPDTTIGDTIWFSGAGLFDLSSDPHLERFLSLAMNGVNDELTVSLSPSGVEALAF